MLSTETLTSKLIFFWKNTDFFAFEAKTTSLHLYLYANRASIHPVILLSRSK